MNFFLFYVSYNKLLINAKHVFVSACYPSNGPTTAKCMADKSTSQVFTENMELCGIFPPTIDWSTSNLPEAWRKFKQCVKMIFAGPLKEKEGEEQV